MRRRLFFVSSFVLVIALLLSGISYAVSPPEQAKICAQENLPNYLGLIGDDYRNFRFSSQEDLARAYLGKPISNVRIGMKEFDVEKMLKEQAEPYAFYVFPVIVDGKAVTDFTVALQDGKWKPIDIGGKLSAVIEDMASKNDYEPESSVVLRFAGETFVIVNKDGQEYGYLPYSDDLEMEEKSKKFIPSKNLRNGLKKKAEIKTKSQLIPNNTDEIVFGGPPEAGPLPFKQGSVSNRLIRYLSHIF